MHAKKSHASLCTRALYITYLMVTKAKQAFTPKMTHGVCTLGTKEYEDPTLGIWEFCLNQIPGSYRVFEPNLENYLKYCHGFVSKATSSCNMSYERKFCGL